MTSSKAKRRSPRERTSEFHHQSLITDQEFCAISNSNLLLSHSNREAYLKRKNAGKSFKKAAAQQNKEENTEEKKEDEKPAEEELKYESGCILKLIDLPENLKYREIKEELFKHAKVQYVDIIPETRTVSSLKDGMMPVCICVTSR